MIPGISTITQFGQLHTSFSCFICFFYFSFQDEKPPFATQHQGAKNRSEKEQQKNSRPVTPFQIHPPQKNGSIEFPYFRSKGPKLQGHADCKCKTPMESGTSARTMCSLQAIKKSGAKCVINRQTLKMWFSLKRNANFCKLGFIAKACSRADFFFRPRGRILSDVITRTIQNAKIAFAVVKQRF